MSLEFQLPDGSTFLQNLQCDACESNVKRLDEIIKNLKKMSYEECNDPDWPRKPMDVKIGQSEEAKRQWEEAKCSRCPQNACEKCPEKSCNSCNSCNEKEISFVGWPLVQQLLHLCVENLEMNWHHEPTRWLLVETLQNIHRWQESVDRMHREQED